MTEFLVRPAEPVVQVGRTHGGFADIARLLNAHHPDRMPPISRQLVERWYKCRSTNRMPDRHPVQVNGKEVVLFDLSAVVLWHKEWLRGRGVVPPIDTIPLFQLDHRGHPVDTENVRSHPDVREGDYRSSILDI